MSDRQTLFWIDSHVHLYACYDIDAFLDCAHNNFKQQVLQHSRRLLNSQYVLFITEGINENARQSLRDHQNGAWQLDEHTDYFIATHSQTQQTLLLVMGQQLVSLEGIELLLLGEPEQTYEPRKNLDELIESIEQGIGILPWGFGKWLGKRGRIIQSLLHHNTPEQLFLGDIPARLDSLGGKRQFAEAEKYNIGILRGVDPLPFKSDFKRVGRYGCCLSIDSNFAIGVSPAQRIIQALRAINDPEQAVQFSQYGEPQTTPCSLYGQLRLRLS